MGMPCRASHDGSHYHGRQEGQGEEASLEPEDGSCAQETGLTGQI